MLGRVSPGADVVEKCAGWILITLASLAACAPVTTTPTLTPTEDTLANGHDLYEGRCAECHGEQGKGHAVPSAPALDASEHAWHHPDWQLRQFIRDGKISLGPVDMPPFRDVLTEEEIDLLIAYIKSLWQEEQQRIQDDLNRRSILPTATP